MDDRSLCDSRVVRARSSILEFLRVRYLDIDHDGMSRAIRDNWVESYFAAARGDDLCRSRLVGSNA